MSHYMMRFSYTPEAWQRLIANPEDRRQVATALLATAIAVMINTRMPIPSGCEGAIRDGIGSPGTLEPVEPWNLWNLSHLSPQPDRSIWRR